MKEAVKRKKIAFQDNQLEQHFERTANARSWQSWRLVSLTDELLGIFAEQHYTSQKHRRMYYRIQISLRVIENSALFHSF